MILTTINKVIMKKKIWNKHKNKYIKFLMMKTNKMSKIRKTKITNNLRN